jgi:hypothetical protein
MSIDPRRTRMLVHRPLPLLLLGLAALPLRDARAQPADSVAIVDGYLAWQIARYRKQPTWPDSRVAVTVALGGRAGARLQAALIGAPLRRDKSEAPMRMLVVDSLVFRDTIAVLFTTMTGRSATPGPWWVNEWRYWFRWDPAARQWRPVLSAGNASDGVWGRAPAPPPASRDTTAGAERPRRADERGAAADGQTSLAFVFWKAARRPRIFEPRWPSPPSRASGIT